MNTVPVLLLVTVLAEPQGGSAPGSVGRFVWPPAAGEPLHYRVRATKTRQLPPEVAAAERAARREAGLFAPRRAPRQHVELTMDVQVHGTAEEVKATYTTEVVRHSLRLKLQDRTEEDVPHLGNDRLDLVWGLPAAQREQPLALPRAALERTFAVTLPRKGAHGVAPASFGEHYGDHLLPVLWSYPLPCWVEHLADVMDLTDEAVIDGKSLISDRTLSFPWGQRNTRVDVRFAGASSSGFTLRYVMVVVQNVYTARDGKPTERTFQWRFDVEGEARYSLRDRAFESVREKVTGSVDPKGGMLAALRDELFAGAIEIDRVQPGPDPKDRKKRRRRR